MYSIKEACLKTGLAYETLKYYCKEGLIPNVKRNNSNYRIFDDNDIAWIKGIICLRKCGMGIAEMKKYIELCLVGTSSIPQRKIMLEHRKNLLLEKLQEINESLEYIATKQNLYDAMLAGEIEYTSYIVNATNEKAGKG